MHILPPASLPEDATFRCCGYRIPDATRLFGNKENSKLIFFESKACAALRALAIRKYAHFEHCSKEKSSEASKKIIKRVEHKTMKHAELLFDRYGIFYLSVKETTYT